MMAEELILRLKKKRAINRSYLTKTCNKIESGLDTLIRIDLEELLEQFIESFNELKLVDHEIETLLETDDLEKELQGVEEYREKYITWRFRANKKIRQSDFHGENIPNSNSRIDENEMRHYVPSCTTVKLPKLMISKFYGNFSEWLTFWNSFDAAIHQNNSLNPIDKFNYLKSHLGGTALNTVEGFSLSADNYEKAIKLLKDRFGREDILISRHMNNLLSMRPLKTNVVRCSICNMSSHLDVMCTKLILDRGGSSKSPTVQDETLANLSTSPDVLLPTLRVTLKGNRTNKTARAIIDTGSQRSYILHSTAMEMEYEQSRREFFRHSLFGGSSTDVVEHEVYTIHLSDINNSYRCEFEALGQPLICGSIPPVCPRSFLEGSEKLDVSDLRRDRIEVLIGADIAGRLLTDAQRRISSGLVAIRTKLGWTVMGNIPPTEVRDDTSSPCVTTLLSLDLENLWKLDAIGFSDAEVEKKTQSLQAEMEEHFAHTTTRDIEGCYEVALPWVQDMEMIPTNRDLAGNQLSSVRRKLEEVGDMKEYGQIFEESINQGIIEYSREDKLDGVHNLPHRPVYKKNGQTSKIRPIFNASARKRDKISLNDCLDKAPNLIEIIPRLLNKIRKYEVGVSSDFEKAFLQIGIKEEDLDAAVFEIAGVDLTGHLILKDKKKAWNVIFTCAVYRGVHLELVTSLSMEAFLQAFRRFIAQRGRPLIMYSDNGTNFKGMANALKKIDFSRLKCNPTLKNITWKFIPPGAPWWGGWWERLIGMMKQLLFRILGQTSLGYEELSTPCRALIDTASQATQITRDCLKKLNLEPSRTRVELAGIGGQILDRPNGVINLNFTSHFNMSRILKTNALVVDKVTSYMPYLKFEEHQFDHLQVLQLDDPQYQYTAPIDILLGADIAFSLFKGAIKYGHEGQPKAIKTLLGWLLFGEIKTFQKKSRNYQKLHTFNCTLNNWEPIFSLWEEELKTKPDPFEDDFNEIYFKTTHERETSGRYIVRLPFKDPSLLGESKPQAIDCFLRMEKILKQQPQVYQTYKDFMQEYLVLGHMNEVKGNGNDHKAFYLPHHPIIKEKSSTTKLRVVFNASSKTTTDITKMYRQILVHPEDSPYQRIIWRDESGQGLKEYELKTLTYGTSCAPFLAIRVLKQLAHDEQIRFPTAEAILKSDFYVDDLLTGCETVENGRKLIRELDQLLQAGGFKLRQWASNKPTILNTLQETDKSTFYANVDRENTLGINLLGINWNPRNDEIGLRKLEIIKNAPTKRNILSQMTKIYDPLGWFAPVMLKIKLMIQTLWAAKLTWDEPIPVRLQESWKALQNDLASLHQVKIPRWIGLFEPATYEIHGFADASQRAYAAMVYIKIIHNSSIHEVTLWSDSNIVLSWLASEHNRWKLYVSNRVKDIQELLPCRWMHVKGEDNPADLAYRGISLNQLLDLELWWHGPPWLKTTSQPYNDAIPVINEKCLSEQRIKTNLFAKKNISYPFITRYSSLNKLKRITGWIFRFFYNCRKLLKREKSGALSIEEIETSFNRIIRCAQQEDYYIDLKQLEAFQPLSGKSPLIKLNPFLDKGGLLRVGGRLNNALLSFDQKHPIILHKAQYITQLVIIHYHERQLHAGVQLTLSAIREKYWIPSGRCLVKQILFKCIKCARFRTKAVQQLMGNLPASRTNWTRPFTKTGIDFAGPVIVKTSNLRNARCDKAYIALFICMFSKAIHIELVTNLTTEAFLAALRRFIGRRGRPAEINTDNATNFVGAYKDLRKLFNSNIHDFASSEEIKWNFIPPSSPHFGGLWEAGIKSVKYHLRRIVGKTKLTFEELTTVLTQIEACLNSRPLCPLTDDPEDLNALTAGHFLIGMPLTAVPSLVRESGSSLKGRWQLVEQIKTDFWKRWSCEYFSRLQNRPKWLKPVDNIKIGTLVLLKDDNLPPLKWRMGRINQVYPGEDGLVRVVSVKTADGDLRRVVAKVCPLPLDSYSTSHFHTMCDIESLMNTRPLTYLTEESEDLVPLTPSLFLHEVREVGVPDLDLIDNQTLSRKYQYIKRIREDLRERFRIEYFGFLRQETRRLKITIPFKVGDMVLIGQESLKRLHWPLTRIIQLYPGKDGLVRVAKVKTSSGDKIRPIQKLYNLEVTPEIRCRDPLTERSPTPEVRLTTEEDPLTSQQEQHHIETPNVVSSYGWPNKKPNRLDLLNFSFPCLSRQGANSKVGEMLEKKEFAAANGRPTEGGYGDAAVEMGGTRKKEELVNNFRTLEFALISDSFS
ncbi:hypothetical protein LAZ67_6003549, partial [Cordylochernes scorpioides]